MAISSEPKIEARRSAMVGRKDRGKAIGDGWPGREAQTAERVEADGRVVLREDVKV